MSQDIATAYLKALCKSPDRKITVQLIAKDLGIALDAQSFVGRGGPPWMNDREYVNFYAAPKVGNTWLMAHHDVVHPESDNANDNSASVLNALLFKHAHPDVGIAITDGEEPPSFGAGAQHFCAMYGDSDPTVINLELTGKGGWYSVGVSRDSSQLFRKLVDLGLPAYGVPFNDASILQERGINSTCLFTCTIPYAKVLDVKLLGNMHSMSDSIDTVSVDDMEDFRNGLYSMLEKAGLLTSSTPQI